MRGPRALLVAGLAVGLAAIAGSCAYTSGGGQTHRFAAFPPVSASPGPERGHVLFQRDCAWCHGEDGDGTTRAPDLVGAPQGAASVDFMLSTGRMPIDYPDQLVKRRDPTYPPQEIADIVQYVKTLRPAGPDIPVVDAAAGSLPAGEQLYNQNCAACHSTTGIGGALPDLQSNQIPPYRVARNGNVIPNLFSSTPRQVAEAMATGPGPMPVFDFDQNETNSIARYVSYLHSPDNRGGASIGGIGPVAEGAIGWIVGLGAMVLVVRWVGTSRKKDEEELL